MKKRFLVAAMAAAMVSPLAANAEATVYGNVHLSINDFDNNENIEMTSNTSAVGVKGKEDLGGGMSALFKVEWQFDADERNKNITDRDQWVGLKGAMGTVKFGTMSNNYKQMGGKVDPMYRTRLEGRGFMNAQSKLHGGASENGGRSTNTIQYSSPKMGGMQMVLNYTVSGSDDETMGLGLRYKQKGMMAYLDYLDVQGNSGNSGIVAADESEAAIKFGGSYTMDALTLGLQYESTEDVIGSDILFLSANFQMNENDNIALTVADVDQLESGTAFAIMYNHKMSKRTNVYVGYGDNADGDYSKDDLDAALAASLITADEYDDLIDFADNTVLTVGIKHKF